MDVGASGSAPGPVACDDTNRTNPIDLIEPDLGPASQPLSLCVLVVATSFD